MDHQTQNNSQRLTISPTLSITVRPLAPTDFAELIDLFEHLGPDSRYNRFHTALTQPTDEFVLRWAKQLADVPPEAGQAWLIYTATPDDPDTIIGGGRYVLIDNENEDEDEEGAKTAEISLAIRDDMQRRGIGTKMLQFITQEAQKKGVERLRATVLQTNSGGVAIVKRLPYPAEFRPEGNEFEVSIDLAAGTQAKK